MALRSFGTDAQILRNMQFDHVVLNALADRALQQIDVKKYDTELLDAGVQPIIKIGIAFRGKTAVVKRK